eukprot:TRINITY_DN182187_c0_g1_i1.p1 TRINITY_DN182187_c0_g1~~TRINITY_DN182187_c0_g1_i1.p1  ORF type:complete len:137 (-),score=23.89 TRINITY_DN182187_c0_g1_i1:180-590(-)
MKRVALVCVVAFVLVLSGCGSKAENLTEDYIDLMNEMADAIEADDKDKLKELQERGEKLEKEMKALDLPEEEKKKLKEKYKDKVEAALKRVMEAAKKKGMSGLKIPRQNPEAGADLPNVFSLLFSRGSSTCSDRGW